MWGAGSLRAEVRVQFIGTSGRAVVDGNGSRTVELPAPRSTEGDESPTLEASCGNDAVTVRVVACGEVVENDRATW